MPTRSGPAIPAPPDTIARPPWRAALVRGFVVAVVVVQLALLVVGYFADHAFFAYQPFNESSTYRVDLYRVTPGGERIAIVNGQWDGHDWDELVHDGMLTHPWNERTAKYGVDSTLDFLQGALDWVVVRIDDPETPQLEARVTYSRNGRGPHVVTLRSIDRSPA